MNSSSVAEQDSRTIADLLGRVGILITLMLTLLTGIIISVLTTRPSLTTTLPAMQTIRPLHTLGTIALLVFGINTLRDIAMKRANEQGMLPHWFTTTLILVFFISAFLAIAAGCGSGLEYVGWPVRLTWLPVGLFALIAIDTVRSMRSLCHLSPEGTWLLVMGLVLTPLGMIERVVSAEDIEITRSLTIEWHALDTIFAGINTALYGLAILLVSEPEKGRPLRARGLYLLAAFALLSTFGHHHYMSGQSSTLKWVAFLASMLGMISFVRHVWAFRRRHRRGDRVSTSLFASASTWTAFAVGSGVLLAVPQVNLLLHGTHAVVGHAMGAVIGADVMIIFAGLFSPRSTLSNDRLLKRGVVVLNVSLSLMVLNLFVAGAAKGILRMSDDPHSYLSVVRTILSPLPIIGFSMSVSLLILACRSIRIRRGSY